jgi:uncharacterized protein YbjT (DUF2867 family)
MRLAILGATGGIGGHVLAWALRAGYPVRALARSPRLSPDYPPPGGWKIARADVAHFIAAVLTEDGWPHAAPAALAY